MSAGLTHISEVIRLCRSSVSRAAIQIADPGRDYPLPVINGRADLICV
jgi:hypothetical protein